MEEDKRIYDKKYLAGRMQSNGQYVFVAEIHPGSVIETTIEDEAIAYEEAAAAENLAGIATITGEETYAAIEIEKTTTEL